MGTPGASLVVTVSLLALSAVTPALAATCTVVNTNDAGEGSLREAIADPLCDPIDFSVAGTITLTSGQLVIGRSVAIDGPGAGNLAISGNSASRVLQVDQGVTVAISGLTIRDGKTDGLASGGGIYNNGGALALTGTVVTANSAGGGGVSGGGILNTGALTLTNSTVSNNSAGYYGGGIYNLGGTVTLSSSTVSGNSVSNNDNFGQYGGGIQNTSGTVTLTHSTVSGNFSEDNGGGIHNYGDLTLTDSTVSGNSARQGGGIYNELGTLIATSSTVSDNFAESNGAGISTYDGAQWELVTILIDSTVSGNSTGGGGGGIYNGGGDLTLTRTTVAGNGGSVGGGLYNGWSATLAVANSTIAVNAATGNPASWGGGIYNQNGTLSVSSSTVWGNTATYLGGGILQQDNYLSESSTALKNTLLADNAATEQGNCGVSGPVPITSAGHNLSDDVSCDAYFTGQGDQNNIAAGLDDGLKSNGGPTQTVALLPGSPAIDAGSPDCPPPDTDQRGEPRPRGGACDIGAYELAPTDTVTITRALFGKLVSTLFVSAVSSSGSDPTLFVTVPDCLTGVPMSWNGNVYVLTRWVKSCGNLDGQIATVTSSQGGMATAPIR